ncbi:MAG: M23 family metallopeptidase [Hyphomicrobiales bacterium]
MVEQTDKKQAFRKNAHAQGSPSVSQSNFSQASTKFSTYELDHDVAQRPLGVGQSEQAASAHNFEPFDIEGHGTSETNPFDFAELPPKSALGNKRLIVTSCVAGVTCSLIVGAAVLGVMTGNWNAPNIGNTAQTQSFGKSDLANAAGYTSTNAYPGDANSTNLQNVTYNPNGLSQEIPDLTGQPLPYDHNDDQGLNERGYLSSNSLRQRTTTINKSAPVETFLKLVKLEHGDSLTGILIQNGVSPGRTHRLLRALNPVYPVRQIARGQQISLTLAEKRAFHGGKEIIPVQISFKPVAESEQEVVVQLSRSGRYLARYDANSNTQIAKPRQKPRAPAILSDGKNHVLARAKINNSVYSTANSAGVPKHVTARMLSVHSYHVDFQRQVHRGDSFEVFYGKPLDGKKTRRPVLLFSQLTLSGRKTKGFYRFTTPDDGLTSYFDESGRSVTTALMRTPISGARISSGFGRRRHPILGYTKMHTGVDFAAPYGTPIKAAGAGTIEVARRVGAYGKYIKIKHAKGYKTAYAHMSRYARGMRRGVKVRQGQVIGYVGSTGRSTGPHLHYEVLRGNRRINPRKLRTASGRHLSGKVLEQFKRAKARIDDMRAQAASSTKVASN